MSSIKFAVLILCLGLFACKSVGKPIRNLFRSQEWKAVVNPDEAYIVGNNGDQIVEKDLKQALHYNKTEDHPELCVVFSEKNKNVKFIFSGADSKDFREKPLLKIAEYTYSVNLGGREFFLKRYVHRDRFDKYDKGRPQLFITSDLNGIDSDEEVMEALNDDKRKKIDTDGFPFETPDISRCAWELYKRQQFREESSRCCR
ncbi:hypothetical protein EHQ61_01395 [Leptospira wolffii]|uniref:hypothetical protein n=1 Tax=Leptospira wolffii TaxID=409998 RepID=UPI001082A1BC|nr:hypothetical protein [Leptospira wolffii]TGL54660.1 hypothetical protein EHQ61_01395 [Leptospira wolffii]